MSQHDIMENTNRPNSTEGNAARDWLVARWRPFAVIAALALLATLPYLNMLRNQFVYDDTTQVLNDPYLQSFRYLPTIFTSTAFSYVGAGATDNYYRPMMLVSYLFCARLFGLYPRPFHVASLLFNTAVVIVLFKATERMFKDRVLALVAAALFALHPVHTEPVVWVAALPDLQSTLFCLLAFWAFLRLPQPNRVISVPVCLGMSISYALALLSKETAVTLPVLATLYEHFYRDDRGQTRWAQKIARYAPLWALDICYFLFRVRILGGLLPANPLRKIPYVEVLLYAIGLIGQYAWKFVWPVRLCAAYIFPFGVRAMLPSIALGVVVLSLFTIVFRHLWIHARRVSFGLLWFFVTLSPVLNSRWIRSATDALPFAERYLYLPSVGLCWVLAWGYIRLFEKTSGRAAVWRRGLVSAAVLLAVLFIVRIVIRNRDWQDDVTFSSRTLAVSPDSVEMHNILGAAYYRQGDIKAAEREWLQAQRIAPADTTLLDNLGLICMDEGRLEEAIALFKKSLLQRPGNTNARISLGMAFAKMGNLAQAEKELRAALVLSPLSVRAYNRLGELYFGEGKYMDAAEQFHRSVQLVPTTKAYLGEGLSHLRMGKLDEAETAFKAAEALNPWDSRTHFVLGFFYGVNGRTSEAIQEYQAGFKLDPNNQEARAAFQTLQSESPGAKPQ
jgi:Flp pilus assembly protein TadD